MNPTGITHLHQTARADEEARSGIPAPQAEPAGRSALVIEADDGWSQALCTVLQDDGYRVMTASDPSSGLQLAALRTPSVVLIGTNGDDDPGLDLCRRLREWSGVPVVFVGGGDEEARHVAALDAGGDDFVPKPFRPAELLARLRAVARRAGAGRSETATVTFGDVAVDLERRLVTRAGTPVHLSGIEFDLLAELARNAGYVLSSARLLTAVWGPAYADEKHYLHVYVGRLRTKLEPDPANPVHIVAERRRGYRLQVDGAGAPVNRTGTR